MTQSRPPQLERETAFIKALSELDRGPLAELRRNLSGFNGKGRFLERLIYDHLPDWYRGGWGHEAAYLVAGLYALVERRDTSSPQSNGNEEPMPPPQRQVPRNLGYVLGHLYRAQDERPSTEKRFLALLDADEDQLKEHLRYAVTLLNAGDLKPDWAQLLADTASWQRTEARDRVRDRWAKAFYQPDHATPSTAQEEHA